MGRKLGRLDVGCGGKPTGDVNIDLHIQKVSNFIAADAHYLPFRDRVFRLIYCHYVLEHCLYPLKVLEEFKRVSYSHVIIHVPNRQGSEDSSPGHLYSWTPFTLKNLLEKVFPYVEVNPGFEIRGGGLLRKLGLLGHFLTYIVKKFAPIELQAIAVIESS